MEEAERVPGMAGAASAVPVGTNLRNHVLGVAFANVSTNNRINRLYRSDSYVPRCEVAQLSLARRMAVVATDVLVVTAIREAVNLYPAEYALASKERGVLVLSAFSGASRWMSGAMRINPWQLNDVARRMRDALEMPAAERKARYLRHATALQEHGGGMARRSKTSRTQPSTTGKKTTARGWGLDTRLMHPTVTSSHRTRARHWRLPLLLPPPHPA